MATQSININAASATELYDSLPGMSKTKSRQIILKRSQAPRQCFTKESFLELCFPKGDPKAQGWIDVGLIEFAPPGVATGKHGRKVTQEQISQPFTSPEGINMTGYCCR